jgi:hypothetical protein
LELSLLALHNRVRARPYDERPYPFNPASAMPLMMCRWKIRKMMITGTVASDAAAMINGTSTEPSPREPASHDPLRTSSGHQSIYPALSLGARVVEGGIVPCQDVAVLTQP